MAVVQRRGNQRAGDAQALEAIYVIPTPNAAAGENLHVRVTDREVRAEPLRTRAAVATDVR